jgi:hypothetical protein
MTPAKKRGETLGIRKDHKSEVSFSANKTESTARPYLNKAERIGFGMILT